MRKFAAFLLICFFAISAAGNVFAQNAAPAGDAPLLSHGNFEPPPPPPGYAVSLPQMQPFTSAPPPPPSAPVIDNVPESAKFNQPWVPVVAPHAGRAIPVLAPETANHVKRIMRSLKTCRTIFDKPESQEELRRLLNTGRIGAEMLGLAYRFPVPSKFSVSHNDRVLRDRSFDAAEYRNFGDFDLRLNGWVKPIQTAVYTDLIFDGRSRRRVHFRSQFTRTGPLTGFFYAYHWDVYGNCWKIQGSLDNIFMRDDGLPSGGDLTIYGADASGRVMQLAVSFPVKVQGEVEPEIADTRHREGQRVSIGNR
ncbi:MAG: hypothetical protein A2W80_00755 [Candidatus Riflebacteria bacterium GWC2_50_8]|nr:MAG: hypothetical protein A2W80_00755 [Candidatus Riflebacteria bacterium GWC2_50_8]